MYILLSCSLLLHTHFCTNSEFGGKRKAPLFLFSHMISIDLIIDFHFNLQVEVLSDVNVLEKEYPCLAAVNRCANCRIILFCLFFFFKSLNTAALSRDLF